MIALPKALVGLQVARIVVGFVLAIAVAGFTATGSSYAAESNNWMNFGTGASSWSQGFDSSYGNASQAKLRRGYPTISKKNIKPMQAAIKRYAKIVKAGGWKPLPPGTAKLKLQTGSSHPTVARLRRRLVITGDLESSGGFDNSFDYYVQNALRRFQIRNGLKPTGTLVDRSRRRNNGTRTITALNVPAKARLRQLRMNLRRMRTLSARASKRYVMVNIPAAQVEAVENGRVVSRHAAVVGKKERATPLLHSAVHQINFNPVWTLPPTVIKKDLIPKGRKMMRAKKNVLLKYGIDAYANYDSKKLNPTKINWNSSAVYNYVYRQPPGPENPLGFVKINFHNAHAVYMHDTPSKRLFGRNVRAASSGCIRVQNIESLVIWMLKSNTDWSRNKVFEAKRSGKRQNVSLKKRVPLHFVYLTAWSGADGVVNFRRDVYGRDQRQGVNRLASNY